MKSLLRADVLSIETSRAWGTPGTGAAVLVDPYEERLTMHTLTLTDRALGGAAFAQ